LQNDARFPEVLTYQPAADSIDAAIDQGEDRIKELQDWNLHGKVPNWIPNERPPIDPDSPRVILRPAEPGEGPSDEKIKQMEQQVWDFAGGLKMRWNRAGRTPAGRRRDVLTFSGSDEVLVAPTGLQLPANHK